MQQHIDSREAWEFSLAFYPQVKSCCLQLQDDYQLNVNLLLILSWTEQLKLAVNCSSLTVCLAQLSPLNIKLTQQLRHCRAHLGQLNLSVEQQKMLKQSLLNTEILAEQYEQALICQHLYFDYHPQPDNLQTYLSCLDIPDTPTLNALIFDLRQAASHFCHSV